MGRQEVSGGVGSFVVSFLDGGGKWVVNTIGAGGIELFLFIYLFLALESR